MKTVWTLEYGYNAYDQEGTYTLIIFSEKPDFHKLKSVCSETDSPYHGPSTDADFGKLARGEEIRDNGSNTYQLLEEVLR